MNFSKTISYLIVVIMMFALCPFSMYAQDENIIAVTEDAYIVGGINSNTTYGLETELKLKNSNTNDNKKDVLLKFDLQNINKPIQIAILKLYNTSAYSCDAFVYSTSQAWDESSVTWSTAPIKGQLLATVPVKKNSEIIVDVTEYVLSQMALTKVVSFRITEDLITDKNISFSSKESLTSYPVIEFTYGEEMSPSDDVYIQAGANKLLNFSSSASLDLKNSNTVDVRRDILLKFNLSTNTKELRYARLKLYNSSSTSCNVDVYSTNTSSWTENTANWENAPSKLIKLFTEKSFSKKYVYFDVTDYIKEKLLEDRIASFRLTDDLISNKNLAFNSKEAENNGPTLELAFYPTPSYVIPKPSITVNNGMIDVTGKITTVIAGTVIPTLVVACYIENQNILISSKILLTNKDYNFNLEIPSKIRSIKLKLMLFENLGSLTPLSDFYETHLIVPNGQSSPFIHPGILNNQADLSYLKSWANASGTNVTKTAYNAFTSDSFSSLNYISKSYRDVEVKGSGSTEAEDHFRNDAIAAYALALRYIKSGDADYKNKSIAIMNDWAYTFETIYCNDYNLQPALEASWALPIWLSAAEIIRYYNNGSANWSNADILRFSQFARKIMTYVLGPGADTENWTGSKALSCMAAGVFLDDANMYNRGYSDMVTNICYIGDDGTPSENSRDFTHAQYNVIATSQGAEISYNQGVSNLYLLRKPGEGDSTKPLLYRQSEFFVREIMGNPPPGGINYSSGNKKCPPYEMLLARYTNQFGLTMPYTSQYVLNYNRNSNNSENHFVGFTTLTHGR